MRWLLLLIVLICIVYYISREHFSLQPDQIFILSLFGFVCVMTVITMLGKRYITSS
uniref:Uncharacterized protein n=1 Tax=viral metagenome TaxID=1070528 RepID=A0A6C0B3D9_9ZZZZ